MSQSVATARAGTPVFAESLPLAWILHLGKRRQSWRSEIGMGEVVDPKLAMLVVLFGVIIALSHLTTDQLERIRGRMATRRWRKPVPVTDGI